MISPYSYEEYYDFYSKVSESHKWPVLPPELLPQIGFVSVINDRPACIVFVYDTVGTQWAVMEWMIADYSFTKIERNQAITECIEAAKKYANFHKLTLFTSCKGAKLKHRYSQAGFLETDTGMTNFIYKGL